MKNLLTALKLYTALALLTGLAYPLAVWGGARLFARAQAEGSLVVEGGRNAGSALVGQGFTRPEYFSPRPSASGYGTLPSGASNLSPDSAALAAAAAARRAAAGSGAAPEMLYASGSGLDPHISPAAAFAQCARVAAARRAAESDIISVVRARTEGRQLGFLGEPRVNVLLLNMELDRKYPNGR